MVEEHQTFQSHTRRFQSWLQLKTKDLADLMAKDSAEDKLEALKVRDCGKGIKTQTKENMLETVNKQHLKTLCTGQYNCEESI